jgi:hypothetical protein
MLRRSLALLVLCALAGCQDYNFNPVGKCVIQPGSSRFKLGGTGTADVLFVVDDSGSMDPEQARLAANFSSFVSALAQTQADRTAAGLEPFEFHVAVTTSSIFESWKPVSPVPTCSNTPLTCNIQNPHQRAGATTTPGYSVACSEAGASCNDLEKTFAFPTGCVAGTAVPGPYPGGSFVSAAGNPAVLHFTKDVWAAAGASKLATLSQQFLGNIKVGTCGSGMEQHFEAGRLAVESALAGKQPGAKPDEWPHAGGKLVVVWLGDEDDCSNPDDPTRSLAFDPNLPNSPGADVCISDQLSTTGHKQFALDRYASYFTGLNRPFGAAFIYSSDPASCADDGKGNRICKPGTCTCLCPPTCLGAGKSGCFDGAPGECNTPAGCGGQIPTLAVPGGSRYAELSALFRAQNVNTFEASVCEANWGTTLQGIAQLVKPPPGLTLPTQPAAAEVALLRIESADGKSSRYCGVKMPDGTYQERPARSPDELATADWWFIDCKTGTPFFDGTTSCIDINHATKHCEPNAGESYVAQYLGVVPSPTVDNPLGGCDATAASASDCQQALGGALTDWTCRPVGTSARGTCTCG